MLDSESEIKKRKKPTNLCNFYKTTSEEAACRDKLRACSIVFLLICHSSIFRFLKAICNQDPATSS